MTDTYDPADFAHGIDLLEQASLAGDSSQRKHILELMLTILEQMQGNLHNDLMNYIALLSLYPDDTVDFDKLRLLHGEAATHWGSSTHWEFEKSADKIAELTPHATRGLKVASAASKGGKSRSIWKDRALELQDAVDAIHAERPDISYAEIKRIATKRHGYPESALKRYTRNPRK